MRRRRTSAAESRAPLTRLGVLPPPPFVGRARDLDAVDAALERPLVVVTGAAGVGKTALTRELLRRRPGAYVRCEEGDVHEAVVARAERALDVVPGTLAQAIAEKPRLLVLDELHRLDPAASARLLDALSATGAATAGRVVALSRDVLPLRRGDAARADLKLDGLSADDARALWARLEETWGPTPRHACDHALERTRGVPLALRREYARAIDKKAWDVAALPSDERRLLCAIAVLRLPATPAALGVLAPGLVVERTVRELVRRQLVDPVGDGRVEVHDVVRAAALEALAPAERRALEAAAAALLDDEAAAPAWEHVDGAALDVTEPIDRLREAVRHLAAAGALEDATARLLAAEPLLQRRGGGGEALALIALLEAAGATTPALRLLGGRVLARMGRVNEALEVVEGVEREHGDRLPEARLAVAPLLLAAGDPAGAAARAKTFADHIRPELRAQALAALAAVDLERGAFDAARRWVKGALDADRGARLSAETRARLRLLAAVIDERDGRVAAARQALGRVATMATLEAGVGCQAAVSAALAGCLAEENRLADAEEALAAAERAAREGDEPALADEIRRRRAVVGARAGRLRHAEIDLRGLAAAARARGDELGALRAELELALLLVARGRALEAARLAAAVAAAAARRGLSTNAADARLARALAALDELRPAEARDLARSVVEDGAAAARTRARAAAALARAAAALGEPAAELPPELDDVEAALAEAELAGARGDAARALELHREGALRAERAGRRADLARALAEAARLLAARGDRAGAEAAAARALTEGVEGGADRPMARALLVRCALTRDEGDLAAARGLAADALTIARAANLGIERYIAAAAAEMVSREAGDAASAEPLAAVRAAAAATLGEPARAAADRTLAELGLTLARPYRLVAADGAVSYVGEIDGALLRLDRRDLVIDGAREQIVRSGKPVADLRRRSLLKRLLFLFAGAPGRTFSKEEIVKRVWGVEYHPLRHDAALFTNIMRLRRLLGAEGEEILRVGDGGYRLAPPAGYLFVDKLAS